MIFWSVVRHASQRGGVNIAFTIKKSVGGLVCLTLMCAFVTVDYIIVLIRLKPIVRIFEGGEIETCLRLSVILSSVNIYVGSF